jgi:hypothetical protein
MNDIERTQIPGHGSVGIKRLSREEMEEARRLRIEEHISLKDYQTVRREFFSHVYEPTLTIRGNSITFNNACIRRLEGTVYVQVLVNPIQKMLVIRPCNQDDRDSIRWCVQKEEKRKSREITCDLFAGKLYDLMGWQSVYRYKALGTRCNYQGEQIYVFDLNSTEVFLPQSKSKDGSPAPKPRRKGFLPEQWQNSFGLPAMEHEDTYQVDLLSGYDYGNTEKRAIVYGE